MAEPEERGAAKTDIAAKVLSAAEIWRINARTVSGGSARFSPSGNT
jgi:hypothetical protein